MRSTEDLYQAAWACLHRGDRDAAGVLVRRGLQGDAFHPGLLEIQGRLHFQAGKTRQALAALETASLVAPLSAAARLILVELYLRGRLNRSARAILRFLVAPDRCPDPLLPALARLCGRAGLYRQGLRICRRLVRLRPQFHPAHYGAAFYLARLNHAPRQVLKHLRAAHALAPAALPYRLALADYLAVHGTADEVCSLVRTLADHVFSCPIRITRLIQAANAVGDLALAARLYERLTHLEKDH